MASRAMKISPEKRGIRQTADTTERKASALISETAVAERAHQLWQARGCPNGSDQEDWFQAEKELKQKAGLAQSNAADPAATDETV